MLSRTVRVKLYVPPTIRRPAIEIVEELHAEVRRRGLAWRAVEHLPDVVIVAERTTAGDMPRVAREALATLEPGTGVIYANTRRGVGVAWASHGTRHARPVATTDEIVSALIEFLSAVSDPRPEGARAVDKAAEELIRRLSILLDQKDELIAALTAAYDNDRRTAQARIAFLEAQLEALQQERIRTDPKWRDPVVLATLAVAIATVVGPVAGALTAARDVVGQAEKVQVECNVTVIPPSA